jgi:SAM-dependent methyltransferase
MKSMPLVYDQPKYYALAFSYRDIPHEVDIFEVLIETYSKIPVRSVLELGCGTGPHIEELVNRGYRYSGLDLNPTMLAYTKEHAESIEAETAVTLIEGDMVDFRLAEPVDFVYTMLGSLYVKNTEELHRHFHSVAGALRPGGLYFLDWCISYDPPWESEYAHVWEREANGVKVKTRVDWSIADRVEQTLNETVTLDVDDHGRQYHFTETYVTRAIYPQEFLSLLAYLGTFEFIGWWNNWDLNQPLDGVQKFNRPITVIQRI